MNRYYGDIRAGQTVRCRFNTTSSAGVPTTLTSGAVTVSKDGSDVTPSGGVTLTTDVGSVTGRHHVVVDTSVDTSTFTAGSEYAVRLSGSSAVGGTSVVGIVVGEWSIANRAVAVDSSGRVDVGKVLGTASAGAAGYVGVDWGHVNAPTTTVVLSGTTVGTVTTLTNAPGDTSGTTTLLSRLTSGRATNLDNLDAAVTTRSAPATAQTIDLTTALSANPTAGTVGASLYYGDKAIGRRNTAQGGTSNTITLDASASSNDNAFRGHQITLTGGTGSGQTATIVGYVGSTKVATIVRDGGSGGWSTTPDNTTTFMIIPQPLANLGMWLGGTVNALQSGRVDAYAGASASSLSVNITGNITGNLSGSVGSVTAAVTLPSAPTDWVTATAVSAAAVTKIQAGLSTAGAVAAATWDLATSGHTTSGTFGAAMAAAGTAGDPWGTAIPGSYAPGTAGAKLGGTVDVNIVTVLGGVPVPADLNNVGLKPTGLDQISMAPEAGVPTTWRGAMVWIFRRFYRSHKTPTALVVESDAGSALTTQAVTDDGQGSESIGPPA